MKKGGRSGDARPSIADHLANACGINLERDQKFESTSLRNDTEYLIIKTII
jgi:hypothetical protein